MKLTEELFLTNKQRNRLKRFRKYENIAYKENDYMEIDFDYILKIQQSRFGKEAKLKPFKMAIKDMKRCQRKDGKKLINIRGVCKN